MLDFHENSKNFQDPRVGTDTPGPGEAVSAIRFNGKPKISKKNRNFKTDNNSKKKSEKFLLGPFLGTIRNELSVGILRNFYEFVWTSFWEAISKMLRE